MAIAFSNFVRSAPLTGISQNYTVSNSTGNFGVFSIVVQGGSASGIVASATYGGIPLTQRAEINRFAGANRVSITLTGTGLPTGSNTLNITYNLLSDGNNVGDVTSSFYSGAGNFESVTTDIVGANPLALGGTSLFSTNWWWIGSGDASGGTYSNFTATTSVAQRGLTQQTAVADSGGAIPVGAFTVTTNTANGALRVTLIVFTEAQANTNNALAMFGGI